MTKWETASLAVRLFTSTQKDKDGRLSLNEAACAMWSLGIANKEQAASMIRDSRPGIDVFTFDDFVVLFVEHPPPSAEEIWKELLESVEKKDQ